MVFLQVLQNGSSETIQWNFFAAEISGHGELWPTNIKKHQARDKLGRIQDSFPIQGAVLKSPSSLNTTWQVQLYK